ncbi:hypothetical protein GCM10017608_13500 [Agromyces luteolus]|uniref:Uncharacterized protein n=1 Tax=Agromyces luteolus TaxID=88373 RepID=A0A7C9HRG2_9MICO|nr:hypothetical protein [Agromyces luteolus]MUN07649.1 hypothetical protein [Agromyces luteolus]GLK27416.1 hypothetical protein GCM10017608_13500 [Agromyces luteolus]
MRYEVAHPGDTWSIMPAAGAGADGMWVAEQRAAYAQGPLAGLADELEAAAREALGRRREGIDTSLYFRPSTMPMTGVLHASLRVLPEGVDSEAIASASIEWMLPDDGLLGEPVVEEFETESVPHGYRVAYVTTRPDGAGATLAGISYGLVLPGMIGLVFSELAHREVVGTMQRFADPVVGSLRVVP